TRPFSFEYRVKDQYKGTDFSHREKSDGRVTAGRYSVLLPDGRRQVVSFTADHLHLGGYQATVEYEKQTPKYKDMIITTNKSVEIHSYKDSSSNALNELDSFEFDYNQPIEEHKNEVTPSLLYAPAAVPTYAPSSDPISKPTLLPISEPPPIPTSEPTPIPISEPIPSTTFTAEPELMSAPAPVATWAPAPITPFDPSPQHTYTTEHATTTSTYQSTTLFSLNPEDTYSSTINNNIQYHENELSKLYHINFLPINKRSSIDYGSSSGQHFHHGYGRNRSPTAGISQTRDILPYRIVGYTGWDEVFST
ncbi:unnamed protein product, partial [Meganyctiphanes norvegica]